MPIVSDPIATATALLDTMVACASRDERGCWRDAVYQAEELLSAVRAAVAADEDAEKQYDPAREHRLTGAQLGLERAA